MKLSPINFYNTRPIYTKQKLQSRMSFAPVADSVCFKSRSFLDLPKEEVYKQIQESLTPENFIGQGTEAAVYKIKNTDFCVKIPYEVLPIYLKINDKDIKNLYLEKNIEPADKVNHIKMKLILEGSVMDYIDGVSPKDYINNKEGRSKLQSDIANMPIKSYKEFLYQISNGIDNEMLFDCYAGNLLVDTNKNKLTAIDFVPIKENPREISPLSDMYSVLTANGAEQETGKKIFENIIKTGLEEFIPDKAPCMDVELFDFVELCKKRILDSGASNTEKLMQKLSQHISLLKRLKKTEYLNQFFSTFLEEKIIEIKDLTKLIK